MCRLLVLGCGAVYLTFGLVVGAAHFHAAVDHHHDHGTSGLHVDHMHLGDAADRGAPGDVGFERSAQHDGASYYLTATALRALDPAPRAMPATIVLGVIVDRPVSISAFADDPSEPVRGPPAAAPMRPRAPPV